LLGAALGALLALGVLALAASRVLDGGVGTVVVDPLSGRGRAVFTVSAGGLNLLVLLAGALGGALLGAVGYAVGREAAPESRRISLGPLALLGTVIGMAVGYGALRAAFGIGATIEDGQVTVSVFRAVISALIAGAAVGSVVGGTVNRVSRPEALGLAGEAWPTNPVAFARESARALGLPALAVVAGIVIVYGVAWVLLESDRTFGLVFFGAIAALILAAAAFAASRPPRQDR
jgi:hypothetical protein